MTYAQKNYNDFQGINSRKWRISQIGCFLTSFSNLLDRFGKPIDPRTLNQEFINKDIYIDIDDGIRDDLSYTSITKHNPNIVVVAAGTGNPPNNNCIVKFKTKTNNFGTHFSLVQSAADKTIIDSWDGKVKKWSVYGNPVGWAAYQDNTPANVPQPVSAVPTTPQYDGTHITILMGWGLSHAAKTAGFADWDTEARWADIARLNGSSDWRSYNSGLYAGLRVRVKEDPAPVTVAQPEPTPAIEVAKATQPDATVEVKVQPKTSYRDSYMPGEIKAIAKDSVIVKDIDGVHQDLQLIRGQKVGVAGTFTKDGVKYAITKRHLAGNAWYGIPLDNLQDYDPSDYIGPLQIDQDEELDNVLRDISLMQEAREAISNLTAREKLVAFIAKIQGSFSRLKNIFKSKKES